MQCPGSPPKLWWGALSSIVGWAPLSLWPWASLELWISLLSSSGGDSWLLFSCHGVSSGGSLWGGCSLYLWHLSLLISFHGSALVVRILSCVTSGVLSLFVAEGLLSMLGASTGDLTHNKGHEEEA